MGLSQVRVPKVIMSPGGIRVCKCKNEGEKNIKRCQNNNQKACVCLVHCRKDLVKGGYSRCVAPYVQAV